MVRRVFDVDESGLPERHADDELTEQLHDVARRHGYVIKRIELEAVPGARDERRWHDETR